MTKYKPCPICNRDMIPGKSLDDHHLIPRTFKGKERGTTPRRVDGYAIWQVSEEGTLFAVTPKDNLDLTIQSYTGTITIYSIEGTPADTTWTNISGNGVFSHLGSGRAAYTFDSTDNGVVTIQVTDNTAETINIEVISQNTAKTDTDTEGLYIIYPEPVHNRTQVLDYLTIQAALNDANSGDLIQCDDWEYFETIHISSNVILESTSWASDRDNTKAIINALNGPGLYSVNILSWVTSFTLRGFTINNSSNTKTGLLCS